MSAPDGSAELFECAACGNLGLGRGEIDCCGEPMRPVPETDAAVGEPSLEDLLSTVFDMSDTELDICLCVMESGGLTVRELAERIDYDRSVVSRHLNHLVDLGVLEKRRHLLAEGGHVYVYSPTDPAVVRESFRRQFLSWVRRATALVDELGREKAEAIVEREVEDPQWRIYRRTE